MAADSQRLNYLLEQYSENTLTADELDELMDLVKQQETAMPLQQWMEDKMATTVEEATYHPENWESTLQRIMQQTEQVAPVRQMRPFRRWWWAAAAVALLLSLALLWRQQGASDEQPIASADIPDVKAPESQKAMIRLADGLMVYLDSLAAGAVATEGSVQITKNAAGQILYNDIAANDNISTATNTLFNPRGSRVIDIRLSDGSRIWLNAGSSVTYPVEFGSGERRIQMEGEAFLEVAKNPNAPFSVEAGDVQVQVLGTAFNVNAYEEMGTVRTTLYEGAVLVKNGARELRMKPGQQAKAIAGADLQLVSGPDLEEAVAWKNGKFIFNGARIETVMRQLENWYDIKTVYEGAIPQDEFVGVISREVNISEVLALLAKTGVIELKLEGKEVRVKKR